MKKLFILLALAAIFSNIQARTDNDRRIVVIMLDGLRWQELFNGADTALINSGKYAVNPKGISELYWRPTQDERRMALMPFTWGFIKQHGLIIGNRWKNSFMQVENKFKFSYPGYSETLCGWADNERITSNDNMPNPNVNVFETINKSEKYKNSVMAYACWGTLRYVLNDERCGFPVQAGKYMPTLSDNPSEIETFLDDMKREMVDFWGDVALDYITYRYASEAMKRHKPKVLFVSFGETDEFAHNGRYDHYLMTADHTDTFIQRLWQQAQDDPFYRDKTTFLVTCDHGRGDGDLWTEHGTEAPRSEETWLMAFGSGIPALGEMENNGTFYNKQIAPTIAALLGVDFRIEGRNVGEKLFFVE